MKIRIFITLMMLVVFGGYQANAQQEYMITQYMYNGLALNPAYAGIHGDVSVGALWREQWTAIDGAPNTQLLSIHSPLNYRYASLGAVLYRDVVGVKTEYTGYFSYAYRIQVGEESKLSMGLQMNLHNFSNDLSRLGNQRGLLQQTNTSDPVYQQFVSDNLGWKWNFGAGMM
ncbi:MAG: PorP/SprF family type IX secretion system membrane protein, partial [Cyclobacteriaceae bacterium]